MQARLTSCSKVSGVELSTLGLREKENWFLTGNFVQRDSKTSPDIVVEVFEWSVTELAASTAKNGNKTELSL